MLDSQFISKSRIFNVIVIVTVVLGSRYHVFLKARLNGNQVFQGYIIWIRKDIGFKARPNSIIHFLGRELYWPLIIQIIKS